MSIYDQLGDSGYLDRDWKQKMLQLSSQFYDDSLASNRQAMGLNELNHDSDRVINQYDNYSSGGEVAYPPIQGIVTDQTPIYPNPYQDHQLYHNDSNLNCLLQFSSNNKPQYENMMMIQGNINSNINHAQLLQESLIDTHNNNANNPDISKGLSPLTIQGSDNNVYPNPKYQNYNDENTSKLDSFYPQSLPDNVFGIAQKHQKLQEKEQTACIDLDEYPVAQNNKKQYQEYQDKPVYDCLGKDIDLMALIPKDGVDEERCDKFFELPYITQINEKKKRMENFNQNLEMRLAHSSEFQIINKDYTQILNVVIHLLEDSNALVFMEAIKTVEYLCQLPGKIIKPAKVKQFIGLLTEKYKETKAATVRAVNKALTTIIKNQNIPFSSIIEHMVCQLAQNNKNSRVKQLILEKVDYSIQDELKELREEDIIGIFKQIKDKIIGFIQKDTNAGVRDAAVSLITTFKSILPSNTMIQDSINLLPKYRITEIIKVAQDRQRVLNIQKSPSTNDRSDPNNQNMPSSQMQPIKSKETSGKEGQQQNKKDQFPDFSYQGRNISGQYQVPLGDIVLSLKKLITNTNVKIPQLQQKWDQAIENLGDFGISETKPIMVSCVNWLIGSNKINFKENQKLLEAILGMIKQIYCIERRVEKDENGQSQELDQAIELVLLSSQYSSNKKLMEALFNVILSAAGIASDFNSSLLRQMEKISGNPLNAIAIVEFVFNWLGSKIDQLLQKGMIFSDFEDLRSAGLRFLNDKMNEDEKQSIIQLMINFKNVIQDRKKQMEHLDESSIEQQQQDTEQDEEYKEEVKQLVNNISKVEIKEQVIQPPPPIAKSYPEQIIEMLDQDFEKGLMMIKNIPIEHIELTFQQKEIIFSKILKIATTHCKNPQQQYQQAYGLKALLWMKEEIFGVEDCFKFTTYVMHTFTKAELEGRENSIELYLMNHWVKDLSLRDLIDRISTLSTQDEKSFLIIFKWFMLQSLMGNSEGNWQIEDFRKIALIMAKNIKDDNVGEFFAQSVEKFGLRKIYDFMEIQLMNKRMEYNLFVSWFNLRYRDELELEIKSLALPNVHGQRINTAAAAMHDQENSNVYGNKPSHLNIEDSELKGVLKQNFVDESGLQSARAKTAGNVHHSKLYNQMREQRKLTTNHNKPVEEESINRYDQIINRLEEQLHNQVQKQQKIEESEIQQSQKQQNFNFYKSNVSQQYQSEKVGYRYEENKAEEDEEELSSTYGMVVYQDEFKKKNVEKEMEIEEPKKRQVDEEVNEILNTKNKLSESTVKENLWMKEMQQLEQEKKRIEREREMLMLEKNKETKEWKNKYDEMRNEHEEVIQSLKEANKCYLTQVGENEELKKQLKIMQDQHQLMMRKFQEFEERLFSQQEQQTKQNQQVQRQQSMHIVQEEKLKMVKDTFTGELMNYSDEASIGIKKIQELLLNMDSKDKTDQDLSEPLYIHYSQIKSQDQKLKLVKALHLSLENEDVLFALPIEIYKSVLDFTLKAFSNEKAKLDKNSIRVSQSMNRGLNEQNEITIEVQKIVSKLLNSKEFTQSLVTLFQLLRNAMPEDLYTDLSDEQKQYLKVIMRCISRITKALHSESPDLIRGFDVLIEMQKIFLKNPPEKLREDIPCLQDFDLVYRGLKDVSDKLMELQPDKVCSFLSFVKDYPQNAFTKYMSQIMGVRRNDQQNDVEEEIYEEGY